VIGQIYIVSMKEKIGWRASPRTGQYNYFVGPRLPVEVTPSDHLTGQYLPELVKSPKSTFWDLVGLGGTWWDLVGLGGTWWDVMGRGGTS
jgi:hypothetical protein